MGTTTWNIDTSHSGVHFSVRHMLVSKVRGHFSRYSGAVHIDEGDMKRSNIEATIDTGSIDTQMPDRDAHLRSPDFLDVEKFPQIHFRSKQIQKLDDVNYKVVGDLTIHGQTREVSLDVEYGGRTRDPWGNDRVGFVAKAAIDRRDFGLTWNQVLETGGIMVGERVDIDVDVEAVRPTVARTA